jgi:pyroglutamyl-peptidase
MRKTILITGFGPFPGAPFNPTEALVHHLARLRRPALADVRLVAHVFATSYRAVDRDLPRLMAQHAPDAILMFGLAARRRAITVETRARNAVSPIFADASGAVTRNRAPGEAPARMFPVANRALVQPIKAARVPAQLSRDAGRYVCNYLSWRALETVSPHMAVAFVHVPQVRRISRPRAKGGGRRLTQADLLRAGEALLLAMAAAVRR